MKKENKFLRCFIILFIVVLCICNLIKKKFPIASSLNHKEKKREKLDCSVI